MKDSTTRQTSGLSRRRLLQLGAAGAAVATAGCSGILGDDDGGDVPGYASYLPVTGEDGDSEGEAFVAYLDIAALDELPDSEDSGGGGGSDTVPSDPMLGFPLSGAVALAFVGALSLAPLGFSSTFSGSESDGGDSDDSEPPIDEMLIAGSGVVVTGDFDTDALGERVTSENENSLRPALEQVDEIGDYTVYANPDPAGEEQTRYAIGSEEIVIGTQEEIQRVVDVINGDSQPAHEAFDEFRWLLSEAGDGLIVTGGYSPDGEFTGGDSEDGEGESDSFTQEFEELEAANGGVGSLDFDSDAQQATARLALSFDELSDEQRSEIESSLGGLSEDISVEFEDNRVTAEGTYSEGSLQGDSSSSN